MASFEELLAKAEASNKETNETMNVNVNDLLATSLAVDTDNQEEHWNENKSSYPYFRNAQDDDISYIGKDKIVALSNAQINISAEQNSQFIPFELNRYYDGIDLANMKFTIYFINADNRYGVSSPVNFKYNNEKIRFYWLVDSFATSKVGKVKFEIHATGSILDESGSSYKYIWKTRPNDGINILETLTSDTEIEPSSDWITSFVSQVDDKIAEANGVLTQINGVADNIRKQYGELPEQYQSIKTQVEKYQSDTNAKLADMYTSDQVDGKFVNTDGNVRKNTDAINKLSEDVKNYKTNNDKAVKDLNDNMQFVSYDSEANQISITDHGSTTKYDIKPAQSWQQSYNLTVDSKIKEQVKTVSDALESYKSENTETINGIKENVTKLGADAITATQVSEQIKTETTPLKEGVATAQTGVATNKKDIQTISATVQEMNKRMDDFSVDSPLQYEAEYDTDNRFTLWEIDTKTDERTPKGSFVIQGGGGGAVTTTTAKIERITPSPYIVTKDDPVILEYVFTSVDAEGEETGEGNATIKVDNTTRTALAVQGNNKIDISDLITLGTHRITLTITDSAGTIVVKTWTIQKVDVRLESGFNDKTTYPMGVVSFDYTPYGSVEKTIHFKLDGKELNSVTTSASGLPMSYNIPAQTHGAHLLEVYATAVINMTTIETNHIFKDIIWYDSTSETPVIGCATKNVNVRQYDGINIDYVVYDPHTETPTVTLAIDGQEVSKLVLDGYSSTWQYKPTTTGTHTLTITCRNTVKEIKVNVEKLDIDLEPVTANLAFDFNPVGKTNGDEDRLWSDGNVHMTVNDGFDWVNGGYQIDENGDQYFRVNAGDRAVIDYKLFADDAKRTGKEFKLVFKTENVSKADATFLSCDDSNVGIQMNVHEAYVKAKVDSLYLPYSEEDIIEFEFNISKVTDKIPMILGYEDGVPTRPLVYTSVNSFAQDNAQNITIGSDDCDVLVYRMKAYSASLTDRGILNNFIADARNADEMISRYTRNQIYNDNGQLTPESLAKACPWLRVLVLEAPLFTNDKANKIAGGTLKCIYGNGDPVLDNWTAYNVVHNGQGTTSNEYGASGRNLEFNVKEEGAYFILGDNLTRTDKVSLTRDSVPNNYFNLKVNIASSENENNALGQKWFNRFDPYVRPAKEKDPKVKDTMEFVNAVLFIRETDENIDNHREFKDNELHYYALGNIGDSKKTDKTRLNDKDDPLEHVIEISDNTKPNAQFTGDQASMSALEKESFGDNKDDSFEFRYISDKNNQEIKSQCEEAWKNFYKFVATSSDKDFKEKLKDYFVVDTALYHYLFTTFYTAIDNRAKNTFWHYAKGADGKYRYDLTFAYDLDTILGINNTGELTMTYGYEDTDYRIKGNENSGYAYNAAESKFFCRIRDLFKSELQQMYVDLESKGCWTANSIIKDYDENQEQFPEELWRVDIQRKYIRTYEEGATRFLVEMMNGRKKYQRRQFLRSQEKYMATKFYGNTAKSDQIMFRCNTPKNVVVKPDYTLHITPYADMYIDVMFGNSNLTGADISSSDESVSTQIRAEAGKEYIIQCPFSEMTDTAVLIYCASQIQSMGDLSSLYIHSNDFSKAIKLKELIIGNSTKGYSNDFLENLGVGNNTLLKKIDVQNTPNLNKPIDLSKCKNLEEFYGKGCGTPSVIFAKGGHVKIAELPAIQALRMQNLNMITKFDLASYNNLTSIVSESSNIQILEILKKATKLNRVRITGINWELDDNVMLDRIYAMKGYDKDILEIDHSVLAGHVHVPVMKEQMLADYRFIWSDIDITYNTLVQQFSVTFLNDDETVLDVQYIDKGEYPVDPITRSENPIPTPTKESTVQYSFSFDKWDSELIPVFQPLVIRATYNQKIREYTITYMNRNTVLKKVTAQYGTTVFYDGENPKYTAEEGSYHFYLFNHWDKSGYVNGDKVINAIYDDCEYNEAYFTGKDLSTYTPVEIYTITSPRIKDAERRSPYEKLVNLGDRINLQMGNDINFDDVEQRVFISETMEFTGKNYYDTNFELLNEDRDFVFAIDYEFGTQSGTLAQCYKGNTSVGFKIQNNNTYSQITWGTQSTPIASSGSRDILVLRHIKGENVLHVYKGNLPAEEIAYEELTNTRDTPINSTLVFGCSKAGDGRYENNASGKVHWCKVWYSDLGDDACRKLAIWTHESIEMQMYGFRRYYLSDGSDNLSTMSFIATNLLPNKMRIGYSNTNAGGFAQTKIKNMLNGRMYNAISPQWKQLIKQVNIKSTAGDKSLDITSSPCYIAIPSIAELYNEIGDPYIKEMEDNIKTISFMTSTDARKRVLAGSSEPSDYWTRSPRIDYSTYFYAINADGTINAYAAADGDDKGVLIIVSL